MTLHQTPLTKFLFFTVVLFLSCQKQIDKQTSQHEEIATAANNNSGQGHLQQTKTFSSEVVVKWMDMQLRVMRTTAGLPPATNSRLFAYSGVALYESVVPGMPAYQTLYGQLNNLPAMPSTENGKAYHWAASANATLAYITKQSVSSPIRSRCSWKIWKCRSPQPSSYRRRISWPHCCRSI